MTDALLEALFEQVRDAIWSVHGSPGEGMDARLAHDVLVGSALVWEQRTVLHLAVFRVTRAGAVAADPILVAPWHRGRQAVHPCSTTPWPS